MPAKANCDWPVPYQGIQRRMNLQRLQRTVSAKQTEKPLIDDPLSQLELLQRFGVEQLPKAFLHRKRHSPQATARIPVHTLGTGTDIKLRRDLRFIRK